MSVCARFEYSAVINWCFIESIGTMLAVSFYCPCGWPARAADHFHPLNSDWQVSPRVMRLIAAYALVGALHYLSVRLGVNRRRGGALTSRLLPSGDCQVDQWQWATLPTADHSQTRHVLYRQMQTSAILACSYHGTHIRADIYQHTIYCHRSPLIKISNDPIEPDQS